MLWHIAVIAVVAVLVAGSVWVLLPPFPPAAELIRKSLSELTAQLGAPSQVKSDVPAPLRAARSVIWAKGRGVADWVVQADWSQLSFDDSSHPDAVSRCLRLRWVSEGVGVVLFLPCEYVTEGRVFARRDGT